MLTHAIARKPSINLAQGITTSDLGSPDYQQTLKQHAVYVHTLETNGIKVIELESLTEHPDAHFVEDTAILIPEIAVITNPGANQRKGEIKTIENAIKPFRRTIRIAPPGTLDGGDVLIINLDCFIGLSSRTNKQGAVQLSQILRTYNYKCKILPVNGGLHLKSSVNYIGNNTILMRKNFVKENELKKFSKIIVDEGEAYAANTLLINDKIITPKGFPETLKKIQVLNSKIIELDMSEIQKMDGGLTCLSLRF